MVRMITNIYRAAIKNHKNILLLLLFTGIYFCLGQYFFGSMCLSQIVAGIPCPACGLTRAGLLLLQGKWQESMHMNPMLPFVLLYFVLWILGRFRYERLFKYSQVYLVVLIFSGILVFLFRVDTLLGTPPFVRNPQNLLRIFLFH